MSQSVNKGEGAVELTRIEPNGDFDANGNDIQHVNFGKILERHEPRLIRMAVRISF